MSDYKESEREELLRYVEELQDRTEKLQEENRKLASQKADTESGKQQTISELSSQISMLKKAAQEKSGKITELKMQIEGLEEEQKEYDRILQENDWIRKENEDLTSQNRDLQKNLQDTRREAKAEADRVEQKKEKEIGYLKTQAWVEKEKLQKACDEQKHGYWIMTGALGIYGLFMTILVIWKSAYIRKDLAAVPGRIGNGLLSAWFWLSGVAGDFAGLADKIPIEMLAVILHWTLVILFFAVIIAIIFAIVILAEKAFAWYRKWHNLKVTGVVLPCALLLLLFVVEEIRYVIFYSL